MKILRNVSLCEHTTFKLGGPAAFFVSVGSIQEIGEALQFAEEKKLSHIVLGGGSNVLFPDDGWNGVVIHINILGIAYEEREGEVLAVVKAGEAWDEFVADTVRRGLWGLENLSGIPGSVGAAPVQNIGAYGVEVSDSIVWVEVYNKHTKKIERILNSDLNFSYRDSLFKTLKGKDFIIVSVCFLLKKDGQAIMSYKDTIQYFQNLGKQTQDVSALDMRNAVLSIRKRKFPDINSSLGTAGSFFKNPVITIHQMNKIKQDFPEVPSFPFGEGKFKVSLAWILDNVLHLKGKVVNSVGVFENQSLVFVNYGKASSNDVFIFAKNIQERIWDRFGIKIIPEVTIVTNKK